MYRSGSQIDLHEDNLGNKRFVFKEKKIVYFLEYFRKKHIAYV